MAKKSLDLTTLLPKQYRDKTLDTLLKNLFNRHVSKADTQPMFGFIGDGDLSAGEIALDETDLERQINQITSLIYAEHGTEKKVYSWPDLVQKLILLGVNYNTIGQWFRTSSYNFVPPIDIDKFCNFQEYFWIGSWVQQSPTLDYSSFGLPAISNVTDAFARSNLIYKPEYYTIERGPIDSVSHHPASPTPAIPGWSDWSLTNLWVHKVDIISFLETNGGIVSFGALTQANRPIIEYSSKLKLNTYQDVTNAPSDSGNFRLVSKIRSNQPPLFDLYLCDGSHSSYASSIFYYSEGSEFPVDASVERRLAIDSNSDFTFEHALVSDGGDLMFFKTWDGLQFNLGTIWTKGLEAFPRYVKYDNSGTTINQDKFFNYKNYYYVPVNLPSYNPTGEPEYAVIEVGGASAWSTTNFWVHVTKLRRSEKAQYIQASRPIIEFNKSLESELLTDKTSLNQLPRFKVYAFDDVTNEYVQIIQQDNPAIVNLNDAYLNGALITNLDDLGPTVKQAVQNTPELLANTFTLGSNTFLQSFKTGQFVPTRDGAVYGYRADVISFLEPSKGTIGSISVATSCVPEIITLTWSHADNNFIVTGSVTGNISTAMLGSSCTASGVTFIINAGATPFADGDTFSIQIKSYVYEDANLYINIGGGFRTFTKPSSIVDEVTLSEKIETIPELRDGIWEVPPQLEWNVQNETRTKLGQGDLYYHLTSVIKAQTGLVGSETGSNNFRQLKSTNQLNLGLGGAIKQFDGRTALLISLMMQEGVTITSILEFARQNYEGLFSSIHTFVEDVLPGLLSQGSVYPPQDGDSIDPRLVESFKSYFGANTSFKQALVDTTSPIQGLAATLPYLGLCPKVLPRKELDLDLNLQMLVHHDGHRSMLATTSVDLLKKIVLKKFLRSTGQETSGIVNAASFPTERPFRGQFWFQASTEQLFVYNVISDVGSLPADSQHGDYSYDRLSNTIYQFNGAWIQLEDYEVTSPWVEIKLDIIEQNIALALETELYDKCPTLTQKLVTSKFENTTDFTPNMKKELERFGIKYGTADVYSSSYNPNNAFTWNYRSLSAHSTWNEIYKAAYGTSRPDLQPWIPAGYATEQALIDALLGGGLVSPQTTSWNQTMWIQPSIATFLRSAYLINCQQLKLSVDLATGNLLSPYSTNFESFFSSIPTTASDSFYFGAMAPVETFWRKTVNYLYSLQKVYFKINPLEYVRDTWGIKYENVGDYSLNSSYGRKESNVDFQLHGDPLSATVSVTDPLRKLTSNLSCIVQTPPDFSVSYTFRCVSRLDNLFEITMNGQDEIIDHATVGAAWSDETISVYISTKLGQYYWGDTFTINVSHDGSLKISASSQPNLFVEGLNQLYVQYRRLYGEDLNISINQTMLKNWVVKAGYRFGGLINTDSLVLKNQDDANIDTSAYKVLIKENKFHDSSWLNSLKIQLVQKGSSIGQVPRIGPAGSPGEDWVYRVDVFNDARTHLAWYKFNQQAIASTFIAMGGDKTTYAWKRRSQKVDILNFQAPFLIRGIQNVVDFIFGYAMKLEDDGWRFNDQENPVIDEATGRPVGYDLLVEQFINQQFSNVNAGSAFVLNPFSRKVWFSTPRGYVSDLFEQIGLEQETVCTILDQNQRQIKKSELRIFRQDDMTEIIFDKPAYTVHLLTSEGEHVSLFENYSLDSTLIYDSFLGQRTQKIFISGDRQTVFSGRLDLGGHFLLGDQMKRNLEDSVSGILDLYGTSGVPAKLPETDYARSLLGFSKKSYFADRGCTDATEFRFWQGMIANKGTNVSLDAFTNSSQFQTSTLDEYWAYRLANYGDARTIQKVELNITPEDGIPEHTNYLLIENDELSLLKNYQLNAGFNVASMGITAYDISTLYSAVESIGYDYVDPRGCVILRPDDEQRWHKYDDLRVLQYLEADVIAEYRFVPTAANKIYVILGQDGKPVRADAFEIVDLLSDGVVYYEAGDYTDSEPYDTAPYDDAGYDTIDPLSAPGIPIFSPPRFTRLNHSTILITDVNLLGRPLKAIAYGPAFAKYSPSSLIDYRSNVVIRDDIIWWDPARGVHHPEAIQEVDIMSDKDPARYNKSLMTYKNTNVETLRPWGNEQVGNLWWNTNELTWQPYSDSKLITDMSQRLNSWGAISDSSTIEVYEWFKSSVAPTDYASTSDVDGEVAIRNTLKRTRSWTQRPVAWRYSDNPANRRSFTAYQPARLLFDLQAIGDGYSSIGRAIISSGSFTDLGISKGSKIAGAIYGNGGNNKNDVYLTDIYGTAVVTSSPSIVIGSSTNFTDGGSFEASILYTIAIEIDDRRMSYRKTNVLGQYVFSNEQDGFDYYIRATHVSSGETQRVIVHDVPISANTMDVYSFDNLGIKLNCTTLFNRVDIPLITEADRRQFSSQVIGSANHDLWLRHAVNVFINIPFITSNVWTVQLDDSNDNSNRGWISWTDPASNPIRDFTPPLNRYEPFAGAWVDMGGQLAPLADDVKARLADPWTWFDGLDYTPYQYTWSNWELYTHTLSSVRYYLVSGTHDDYMKSFFTYDIPFDLFTSRVSVYVNEVQLAPSQWEPLIRYVDSTPIGTYVHIHEDAVQMGDMMKIKVLPVPISGDDLRFDPAILDNIFKNTQFKIDFPHVYELSRDDSDHYTTKNYYFWVKNRVAPGKNKRLSTSKVAELLHQHDGAYEAPQIMKQYNQIDGRPNRYSVLSVRGLGTYVHQDNQYKLRIANNGTLRNDDKNMTLKNAHVEWILLRPGQPNKIPKTLWDKLTETMVGKTAVNQLLPFSPLQKYDDRNNTNDRFGFGDGQILAEPNPTIDTVKDTILAHTRVNKYQGLLPEMISYTGFDINQLDSYLSTASSIRKFMADLWRFAKPKQINEIFFAVLLDSAAKNLELTDFFKTSFISLSDIRVVNNGS